MMSVSLAVLLLCLVELYFAALPQIKSAMCVREYTIKHHYYVADVMTAEVLMCRCDCDMQLAANYFGSALENFRVDCQNHLEELRGFCQEVIQEGVTLPGCTRKGYAFCQNKLTAKKVYNFTTLDIKKTIYRITFDDGQIVESKINQKYFIVDGSKFKIYIYGDKCEPSESYLRLYKNIHSVDDQMLESCKTNELGNKFTHTRQVVITGNFTYQKQLWRKIKYSKRVCVGKLSAFTFNPYENEPDQENNCKIIPPNFEFRDVTENNAYLYDEMDLILIPVRKKTDKNVSSASIDNSNRQLLNLTNGTGSNPNPETESSCSCIDNIVQNGTLCDNDSNYTGYNLYRVILAILIGILLQGILVYSSLFLWRKKTRCSNCKQKLERSKSSEDKSCTEPLRQ